MSSNGHRPHAKKHEATGAPGAERAVRAMNPVPGKHLGASREPTLQFLALVVALNGLVCMTAPAVIVLRNGGEAAPVGDFIFVMAVAALALTPLEIAAIWLVVAPRFKEHRYNRRSLSRIDAILRSPTIVTAFQPIYHLASGRIVGAEGLTRLPAAGGSPEMLFSDAERVGRGLQVELLAVRTALAAARDLPAECYIAVDVSPAVLGTPELTDTLRCDGQPDRIVVELTERTGVDDYARLQEARAELRQLGIRLAVDDAGAGYASMRHIVALTPDIIKIDRSLVAGIDTDPARRALVAAVVMFALESGASVVGEGVETPAELQALIELGVDSAEGYHLGRPSSDRADWQAWPTSVLGRDGDGPPLTTLRPAPPS